jgi:serine/threonine-protein kinase
MKQVILQNRYKILAEIGRGGMGAVFLSTDLRLNCQVALKQMLCDEEFSYKRFEREANLLANLQHSNLPKVTDFFSDNGKLFLVMEYISGRDLQEIIKNHAQLIVPASLYKTIKY